ncbi:MAG: hypothetical protein AAGM22_32630 [Acidobacteriota bacterium]
MRVVTAIPGSLLSSTEGARPHFVLSLGGYSIRITEETDTRCVICSEATGSGPVGHFEDAPICDRCLDEGCKDLGMILALITAARIHDSLVRQSPDEQAGHLETLGAFIASFGRFASRWGQVRIVEARKGEDEVPS